MFFVQVLVLEVVNGSSWFRLEVGVEEEEVGMTTVPCDDGGGGGPHHVPPTALVG